MAWCHQATSHHPHQCWPRSMLPCGVSRPQWVNSYLCHTFAICSIVLYWIVLLWDLFVYEIFLWLSTCFCISIIIPLQFWWIPKISMFIPHSCGQLKEAWHLFQLTTVQVWLSEFTDMKNMILKRPDVWAYSLCIPSLHVLPPAMWLNHLL